MAGHTGHNESKAREANNVGYLITILIFLFAQTGAAFYWAGGVSKSNDALREQVIELKEQVHEIKTNYGMLNMLYAEVKARQDSLIAHLSSESQKRGR